ncbi:unnamed protein product [Miscanthus lutarioriparius]|uniref:Pentatricopeptide repeat-containing protein n=1 Tax=Miscanthus lutarioriparius TaxID=422564 RepID=A0A811MB75_9POAL|nr:unnamed protein product [Miscanthus lutarioriparius]
MPRPPMPPSALPRGAHAVLVTSGHLRHLDPHLQVPPLLLANSLIAAFSRAALPRLALPLLRRLLAGAHPLRPDSFTFPPLVRAAHGPASAAQLHACALRLGLLHPNVFASGSLVHAYLRFGRVAEAYRVFDEMPDRDVPAWNAMLSGLCRNARAADAVALFGRMVGEGVAGDAVTLSSLLPMCVLLGDRALALVMHVYAVKHGLSGELFVCNALIDVYGKLGMLAEARWVFGGMALRDLVTWNSIISAYEQGGKAAAAVELFHGMMESGVSPDVLTLVSLASAIAQCGDERGAKSVHCYVRRRGWDVGDIIAGNAMVDMYAKLSKIDAAQMVFDNLPDRDVVSWNTLITGYMQNGLSNEAIRIYNDMQNHEGLKPIQGTFVSVLPAYSNLGALQQGMRMHALSIKTGLNLDVYVSTCLIDLYAKCGKLVEAMLLFEHMPRRSTGPWNAIIAGLGVHGHATLGLVDQGRSFFDSMQTVYGIVPIAKHYACMVDMLGRAGQLDKAFEFIQGMPIKPDSAVWGALLGACRIHGNVEMGKVASQNLFELDPKNVGYYVLMSNMYAKIGKWDGVDAVRSLVRARICRRPWMEFNGGERVRHPNGELLLGPTLLRYYAQFGNVTWFHTPPYPPPVGVTFSEGTFAAAQGWQLHKAELRRLSCWVTTWYGEDYENRMVEGAPIRRTPVLLRRGSPCTLPAGKIAAGTLELLGCTALPSGCGSRLGTVPLGTGHLCCKVQCCACRDSGDRLAENTVADWESETRMEATSPAQRAVRCLSFAQRPPLVLWVFRRRWYIPSANFSSAVLFGTWKA